MEGEFKIRTSRKKFIYFYIFGFLVLLLYPRSEFYNLGGVFNLLFYLTMFVIVLYPEINILYTEYIVGKDVITEIKGFIAKKRTTIPVSSISHIITNKGVSGAILDYGDIVITSFTDLIIIFEGISKPEKMMAKIENMMERARRKR